MEWHAQWIWESREANPRNLYLNVRKEFTVDDVTVPVTLAISADSRYTLWVNGTYLGHGPVRNWLGTQWRYDLYDLGDVLRAGVNVVAIQAQHWGVSTFQYMYGRAGVICQIDSESQTLAATDATWAVRVDAAYERRTPRVSCQMPFTESYDACLADPTWMDAGIDTSTWSLAKVIAQAGDRPWGALIPRPIPFLTQTPTSPSRLIRSRVVTTPSLCHAVDLKSNLFPEDTSSNPRPVHCLLGTIIRNMGHRDVRVTLRLAHWPLTPATVRLNGVDQAVPDGACSFTIGIGDTMLMIDITNNHDHFFARYPVLDFPADAKLELVSPKNPTHACPWVTVGPYSSRDTNEFRADWACSNTITLNAAGRVKQVPESHFAPRDVFGMTAFAVTLPGHDVGLQAPDAFLVESPDVTTIVPPSRGAVELLVDFGAEQVGFLEFELNAPAGVEIDFNGFEYIAPNNPDVAQWTNHLNNTLRYVTRAGRQKYRSIARRGFRYLSMTLRFPAGTTQPLTFRALRLYANTFPYTNRGDFKSSDELLNAIWNISRHTVRLCSEDTFVDCPAYEQVYWVGDSRNEALFAYLAFGDYRLARHCLLLAGESLARSPLVESQVPSGWENIIPDWSFLWAIACEEYLLYTDEDAFAEEIWPSIKLQSNNVLARYIDERGLFNIKAWNFLDWAPMDVPNEGVVTHQNMFLVKALRSAAVVADRLGHDADAERWRDAADRLREAINAHLWSDNANGYADCIRANGDLSPTFSQQTQVVACIADIPGPERVARVASYLPGAPDGWVQIGSPFMLAFVLEGLAKVGNWTDQIAIIRNGWGLMVGNDATACWETFPNWEDRNRGPWMTRSHCHAWSAAPCYALPAWTLGVRPLLPGFRRFTIDPHLLDLDWARGCVPTIHGDILVEVQKVESDLQLEFTVPQGLEAIVYGQSFLGGRHTLQVEYT